MTRHELLSYLPHPPRGFGGDTQDHYEVEQRSPMIQVVWLVHSYPYDYACGKDVRTVWGFIKNNKVYAAKNSKTMRPKSVCDLVDAHKLSPYTAFTPTTTSLLHIL